MSGYIIILIFKPSNDVLHNTASAIFQFILPLIGDVDTVVVYSVNSLQIGIILVL